jgi:hypothetical protein
LCVSYKRLLVYRGIAVFDNDIMRTQYVIYLELRLQILTLMDSRQFSPLSSEPHDQTLFDVRSMLPHQDSEVPVIQRHT